MPRICYESAERGLPRRAKCLEFRRSWKRPSGFEPPTSSLGSWPASNVSDEDASTYEPGDACSLSSLARNVEADAELAAIVVALPSLSRPIRDATVAMIRTATRDYGALFPVHPSCHRDDQDMPWVQMQGDHFMRNRQESGESRGAMVPRGMTPERRFRPQPNIDSLRTSDPVAKCEETSETGEEDDYRTESSRMMTTVADVTGPSGRWKARRSTRTEVGNCVPARYWWTKPMSVADIPGSEEAKAPPLGVRHSILVYGSPRVLFSRVVDTGAYGWTLVTLLGMVTLIGYVEVQTGLIDRVVDEQTEQSLTQLEESQGHLIDRIELRDRMESIRKSGEFNKLLFRLGKIVFAPSYWLASFLIIASILYAVVALTGRKPEYQTLMSICVYSGFVVLVAAVVRIAMVLSYRTTDVDTSLGMMVPPGAASPLVAVDPFRIWFWVLVAIGLTVTRQLSRRTAIVCCVSMGLMASGVRIAMAYASQSWSGSKTWWMRVPFPQSRRGYSFRRLSEWRAFWPYCCWSWSALPFLRWEVCERNPTANLFCT